MIKTYTAISLVVFDDKGKIIYRKDSEDFINKNIYSFEGEGVLRTFAHRKIGIFTLVIDNVLLNYIGMGIVPTNDEYTRKEKPCGYIFMVREIDQEGIDYCANTIGENVEGRIFLDSIQLNDYIKTIKNKDYAIKELRTFSGGSTAFMCFTMPDPKAGQLADFANVFCIVSAEILFVLISILMYVNIRISRPLKKINKAFKENSITPVMTLTKEKNEFGQISLMIEDFFEQKEKIAAQNERMQHLNEELQVTNANLKNSHVQITSSIVYASRLQHSMLLAHSPNGEWFSDSFTIYLPKDIVGGDFYVAQTVGIYNIAVIGDCTGHGVPGAILVSMGISFLYQIIDSRDVEFMPDIILNKMREKVVSAFSVDINGEEIEDGMDVAIVIHNKETRETYFAGAGRPAVIVKNGELHVVKGDKMPIGRFVCNKDFTRKKLDVSYGDSIYLYSDGCTDQVGGPNVRKIMSKNFQNIILKYSNLDFKEQKECLEQFISDWKANQPQTDDISMLAFKI